MKFSGTNCFHGTRGSCVVSSSGWLPADEKIAQGYRVGIGTQGGGGGGEQARESEKERERERKISAEPPGIMSCDDEPSPDVSAWDRT